MSISDKFTKKIDLVTIISILDQATLKVQSKLRHLETYSRLTDAEILELRQDVKRLGEIDALFKRYDAQQKEKKEPAE